MVRIGLREPTPQIPLGLEPVARADSDAALRAAYKRLGFSRRYTFEEAMQDRAFSICIRNFAEATALRINRRRRRR